MNTDDIRQMFEGISAGTKEAIARGLGTELAAAILAVNKDLDQAVFANYYFVVQNARAKAAQTPTQENKDYLAVCEHGLAEAKKLPENLAKMRDMLTPPPNLVFNSFRLCDLDHVKVVLLGQDPYIKRGEATGVSFGVPRGVNIPPSLKNIYNCLLHNGLIKALPTHGNIDRWAEQGVLLLNAALTTRIGQSNAHSAAWSKYTDALIKTVSGRNRKLVFILFGGFAQGKASLIDKRRHIIFEWGHPSPLNSANKSDNPKNFKYCTAFSRTNDVLTSNGDAPIDWNPDSVGRVRDVITLALPGRGEADGNDVNDVNNDNNDNNDDDVTNSDVTRNITTVPSVCLLPTDISDLVRQSGQIDKLVSTNLPLPVGQANSWIRPTGDSDPTPSTIDTLWIFTDGGASGNGRENCQSSWGFYMTDGCTVARQMGTVEEKVIPGEVFKSSNNRGELTAILMALKAIQIDLAAVDDHGKSASQFSFRSINIVSDSEYSIKSITIWSANWLANPTKHQLAKKKNLDLILPCKEATDMLKTTYAMKYIHVNSHLSEPSNTESHEWFLWKGNDIVDKLCGKALGRGD